MAIGLSEEHQALRESVLGWAERNIPAEVVRAVVTRAKGDPSASAVRPGFWDGLASQGLLGLHLPEEHGGSGYGLLEAAVAVEALAERVAPGPYLPTVLAGAAVLASGGKAPAELLPGMAGGALAGAVALGRGLTGVRDGDGDGPLTVTGTIEPVLGGADADLLVLPVTTDRGEEWIAVGRESATATPIPALDLTRGVARVTLDGAAVPAERVLGGLRRGLVRDLAAILFGAEAAGLAAWCVSSAAAYARVREQFGRPIGQFQGIKHKIARMRVELEKARATVWDAARAATLGGSDGSGREEAAFSAAVAAVTAPDAASQCAKDAIQTFGGIGYTFEHDVHLYYRRALTIRALLGPSADWASAVAGRALAGVTRKMEIDLPAEAQPARERLRAEIAEIAGLGGVEQRRALAASGFVMPHLPRPWGRDATALEQVLIHQELRAAGVRPPQLIIGAWVVPSLVAYGTPEQRERFLPPTLSGEMIWCQLFSEPGAGSDLASLSTRAERAPGGWRLTGQKVWTSIAHVAQWAICIARSSPDKPKHKGITYFLVDMKAPGVTVRPLTEMTGENMFNEVFLDDVFVPEEHVVGEVDDGWRVARNTLSNERVSLSGGAGRTGSTVPDLLALAGRLGRDPSPADLLELGAVVSEGHALEALALRVTLKQIAGGEPGGEASVRKLLSTTHAQRVAECAVSLLGPAAVTAPDTRLGGPGYWTRAALGTRAMTIYGGTTEVQLNIIAERMLGLPRDPEPGA
ncbi:acyl-CoA dehydrogenase [Spongiactinospora sp. TRM90649]|uniref:acyl-CoA dehydrogenase n=1 Tax=Spongiactinospora sp. TRM90649 TaxID=3031114 RepID=UPI0023F8CFE9|nr:acyl-CoA dehydrogenase [Spongiactinospora sp. TRM90649]MDF5751065.1 acyl-CoA dehydrogenase [Spongiactinospora sp. TRM90649]